MNSLVLFAAKEAASYENEISAITLLPKEVRLAVGDELSLLAKVIPNNVRDRMVLWSSSDEAVVSVNDWGSYCYNPRCSCYNRAQPIIAMGEYANKGSS